MKALVLIVLGIAVVAIPMFSQSPAAGRPQFEVVSVKVSPPPLTQIGVTNRGGRFVATGFSLKMLVGRGYALPEARVLGGPGWVESERYDIEAKAPDSAAPNQLASMILSLLEDRFRLKAHKETRELPVYELVVPKNGPKMKLSEDQTPPAPAGPPPGGRGAGPLPASPFDGGPLPRGVSGFGIAGGRFTFQGSAIPVATLVNALQQRVDRPVIDKTGLKGLFDIKLEWTPGAEAPPSPFGPNPNGPPPPPVDDSAPTIFTAIQEKLGLRLESSKGPVDVVVIESAEKP